MSDDIPCTDTCHSPGLFYVAEPKRGVSGSGGLLNPDTFNQTVGHRR